jgi:hypothetical protein
MAMQRGVGRDRDFNAQLRISGRSDEKGCSQNVPGTHWSPTIDERNHPPQGFCSWRAECRFTTAPTGLGNPSRISTLPRLSDCSSIKRNENRPKCHQINCRQSVSIKGSTPDTSVRSFIGDPESVLLRDHNHVGPRQPRAHLPSHLKASPYCKQSGPLQSGWKRPTWRWLRRDSCVPFPSRRVISSNRLLPASNSCNPGTTRAVRMPRSLLLKAPLIFHFCPL